MIRSPVRKRNAGTRMAARFFKPRYVAKGTEEAREGPKALHQRPRESADKGEGLLPGFFWRLDGLPHTAACQTMPVVETTAPKSHRAIGQTHATRQSSGVDVRSVALGLRLNRTWMKRVGLDGISIYYLATDVMSYRTCRVPKDLAG